MYLKTHRRDYSQRTDGVKRGANNLSLLPQ